MDAQGRPSDFLPHAEGRRLIRGLGRDQRRDKSAVREFIQMVDDEIGAVRTQRLIVEIKCDLTLLLRQHGGSGLLRQHRGGGEEQE
ncbi:hypothetical protein Vadar_026397 [Vaccinium darrowii]|uniref:Uncharacterized protein n=1 Tax=Vaccinium darrowii TaxID=229202 RepID=A0ACB7XL82_9ERIC|nr:hypothetical protein Vadar_026397 [Vaccinium darrowii]